MSKRKGTALRQNTDKDADTDTVGLVGLAEIQDLLTISKDRVGELTFRGDFPAPTADLAQGAVWLREEVEAWVDEHTDAVAALLRTADPGPAR